MQATPQIGLVGMRVDERAIAADHLHEFVDMLGIAGAGLHLRSTQNYVRSGRAPAHPL